MAVCDAHVFPGFLSPVLTQLFFPKPPTTFLTCFCRGERRKYAGKKVRLSRGSNSQPPSHESDTLTTEPPGRGGAAHIKGCTKWYRSFESKLILKAAKIAQELHREARIKDVHRDTKFKAHTHGVHNGTRVICKSSYLIVV